MKKQTQEDQLQQIAADVREIRKVAVLVGALAVGLVVYFLGGLLFDFILILFG